MFPGGKATKRKLLYLFGGSRNAYPNGSKVPKVFKWLWFRSGSKVPKDLQNKNIHFIDCFDHNFAVIITLLYLKFFILFTLFSTATQIILVKQVSNSIRVAKLNELFVSGNRPVVLFKITPMFLEKITKTYTC